LIVTEALRARKAWRAFFFILEDGMPIEQYREVCVLLLVSIAAVNDLRTRRIPNRLLLAGLAVAFVLCVMSVNPSAALLAALGGAVTGLVMFLPFYLVRGMAAGDVKLLAVVGAFSGAQDALQIAVLTWCAGGVMALVLLLLRGRLMLAVGNVGRMLGGLVITRGVAAAPAAQESAGSMPYGVAIAIGTVAVLLSHYS
jgi:prepilin peptidase CpaA